MLLLWTLLGCGTETLELESGDLVLMGARLAGESSPVDVVVSDGYITAMLEPGTEFVGGTQVLAEGQVLAPGLIDTHVHIWDEGDLVLYPARGVTTVRNLSGSALHLDWREQLQTGDRLGPRLLSSGPIVDGPDAYWPGSAIARDAQEGAERVREQHAAGYDLIKVYDALELEAWEGILAEAQRLGMPVAGHVPDAVGHEAVVASSQASIEHLDDFLAHASGHSPGLSFSPDAGQAALADLDDARAMELAHVSAGDGVFYVPTLSVMSQYGQASSWDFDDPRLAAINPQVVQSWRQTQGYISPESEAWFADYSEALCGFVATLDEAGASLALGTDTYNAFVLPGWAVHEEMQAMVDCGLPIERVLALATQDAAALLGQSGELGVLAVGARADILILDQDPVLDLQTLAEPAAVVLGGHYLSAEELAEAVQQVEAGYAQ